MGEYSNIRLLPCPRCGGLPVMLIQSGWPHKHLHVECSHCGKPGAGVFFGGYLLPDLAAARRQAAAAWNERADGDA